MRNIRNIIKFLHKCCSYIRVWNNALVTNRIENLLQIYGNDTEKGLAVLSPSSRVKDILKE
jgi:hypothetical protein